MDLNFHLDTQLKPEISCWIFSTESESHCAICVGINPPRSLPFPPSQQGVAKVVGVSTSSTVTKRTKAETEKKGRRFQVLGGLYNG